MWLSYIFISNYISSFEYYWIILLIFALEIYGNTNAWDFIGIREAFSKQNLSYALLYCIKKSDGLRIIPEVRQFK